MNAANIVTAVSDTTSGRFDSGESTAVYNWLNQAYGWVWAAYDWPWKRVTTTGTHTSGTSTVTLPTDYGGRILRCWNSGIDGTVIKYFEPNTFLDYVLGPGSTSTGVPSMFTVYDTTWRFYPVPSATATFTYAYQRRPAVKTSGGTITDRIFSSGNSTDVPIWDDQFHHVLVSGTQSVGLVMQNDPTYKDMQSQFMMEVDAMADFYLPSARGENLQYGADNI